jgi:hypothetical protein
MRCSTGEKFGYLALEFQTKKEVWHEVESLRRIGESFRLLIRKPSQVACRHKFVPTALAQRYAAIDR